MGIPRFISSWINQDSEIGKENAMMKKTMEYHMKYIKIQFDKKKGIFCFDLNGLIHTAYEKIIENNNFTYNDIVEKVYLLYYDFINQDFNFDIFIAIDGIAPTPKNNQQRERRYNSGDIYRSNITAGTKFMYELNEFFKYKLTENSYEVEEGDYYDIYKKGENRIFLSNANHTGEGEHKIMRFLNEKDYDITLIHGLDTDLLIRSIINKKNIIFFLYQNNKNSDIDTLVNVNKIYEIYKSKFNFKLKNKSDNFYKNIFLLFSIPVGNDFLPKFLSLSNDININNYIDLLNMKFSDDEEVNSFVDAVENYPEDKSGYSISYALITFYSKMIYDDYNRLYDDMHIIQHNILNGKESLMGKALIKSGLNENSIIDTNPYIAEIQMETDENEINKIIEEYWTVTQQNNETIRYYWYQQVMPNKKLISLLDSNFDEIKNIKVRSNDVNFNTFSNKKLKEINVIKIFVKKSCELYLKTAQWLSQYYFLRTNDVFDSTFYPYHISPLFYDLQSYYLKTTIPYIHEKGDVISEKVKLKMVSNPKSLLAQNIKLPFDEINKDLFPISFKTSDSLSRADYDVKTILPQIYPERLT